MVIDGSIFRLNPAEPEHNAQVARFLFDASDEFQIVFVFDPSNIDWLQINLPRIHEYCSSEMLVICGLANVADHDFHVLISDVTYDTASASWYDRSSCMLGSDAYKKFMQAHGTEINNAILKNPLPIPYSAAQAPPPSKKPLRPGPDLEL